MAGINTTLFTAKQALMSSLTAINVTGSNVANLNTPGYSRLRPIFESTGTVDSMATYNQGGVQIADVERIYDKFLEAELVTQESKVAKYSSQRDFLQSVEIVLNENIGGGVNDALSEFFNAWGNLSGDSSSLPRRDAVITKGQNLAYVFNQQSEQLSSIQLSANEKIINEVNILNQYLSEMAALNTRIIQSGNSGAGMSSALDKRGEMLKEISKLIDINYLEKEDGSLFIYQPSTGQSLVQDTKIWQLDVQRNPDNENLYDIVFKENPSVVINDQIKGGTLGALLEVRDKNIPSYLDQLNQTAASIINKVNEAHGQGYDQYGNPGELFFDLTTRAIDMRVSSSIAADSRKVAASVTLNADGNNALSISAIRNDQMFASVVNLASSAPGNTLTSQINNVGQVYKNTITNSPIEIQRTAGIWGVTLTGTGGYESLKVLSSSDSKVTLSLNGDNTADITLNLSGAWNNGDTITFNLTKSGKTVGIEGYYGSFITGMGQDVVNATQALNSSQAILDQQMNQREKLSGVSLDEEMMNLIRYQMAYGAAGRLTTTINEMMDILMNLGL